MRITFITVAAIAAVLGIIMAILPFGSIGVLPGLVAFIAGLIAYFFSKKNIKPKKLSILFSIIGLLVVIVSSTKSLWIKDEIAIDKEFDKKEEISKKEAIKELKEMENDLDEIEDIDIEE